MELFSFAGIKVADNRRVMCTLYLSRGYLPKATADLDSPHRLVIENNVGLVSKYLGFATASHNIHPAFYLLR